MIKLDFILNSEKIQLNTRIPLVSLDLNLGKSHAKIYKPLEIEFTDDASKIHLNQNLLKQFNFLLSEVDEITEFTIRGNAEGTQRIQGDETQKV